MNDDGLGESWAAREKLIRKMRRVEKLAAEVAMIESLIGNLTRWIIQSGWVTDQEHARAEAENFIREPETQHVLRDMAHVSAAVHSLARESERLVLGGVPADGDSGDFVNPAEPGEDWQARWFRLKQFVENELMLNYIGQEGKGGARGVQTQVLSNMDRIVRFSPPWTQLNEDDWIRIATAYRSIPFQSFDRLFPGWHDSPFFVEKLRAIANQ